LAEVSAVKLKSGRKKRAKGVRPVCADFVGAYYPRKSVKRDEYKISFVWFLKLFYARSQILKFNILTHKDGFIGFNIWSQLEFDEIISKMFYFQRKQSFAHGENFWPIRPKNLL
jgi:hypothetical protein